MARVVVRPQALVAQEPQVAALRLVAVRPRLVPAAQEPVMPEVQHQLMVVELRARPRLAVVQAPVQLELARVLVPPRPVAVRADLCQARGR